MKEKDFSTATPDGTARRKTEALYAILWGEKDIHTGIYDAPDQSIVKAAKETRLAMTRKVPAIKKNKKILDIGSGYGTTARWLVEKFGCRVDCLDPDQAKNDRNHKLNKAAGLEDKITVVEGVLEKLPFTFESFDLVWSMDALLYSDNKSKVFREVARVLKPGGRFIFTVPMQSDDCPDQALEELLAHTHLESLGSVTLYKRLARRSDLETVLIKQRPKQLIRHYTKILEAFQKQEEKLIKKSTKATYQETVKGLQQWINAGKKNYLTWGILQFQKRND